MHAQSALWRSSRFPSSALAQDHEVQDRAPGDANTIKAAGAGTCEPPRRFTSKSHFRGRWPARGWPRRCFVSTARPCLASPVVLMRGGASWESVRGMRWGDPRFSPYPPPLAPARLTSVTPDAGPWLPHDERPLLRPYFAPPVRTSIVELGKAPLLRAWVPRDDTSVWRDSTQEPDPRVVIADVLVRPCVASS